MPLPVFNPPMRPSAGTGHSPEVKLRTAAFGDGYTQSSPAGVNHIRQVMTFRWDYLNLAEARAITAFLEARGGYQPFEYQLWGEDEPRQWTCESWSMTEGHPTRVTATFKESFVNRAVPASSDTRVIILTNEEDFDQRDPGVNEVIFLVDDT